MKLLVNTIMNIAIGSSIMISTLFAQQKTNGALQTALTASDKTVIAIKNRNDDKEIKKAADKISAPIQQAINEMAAPTLSEITKISSENEKAIKELQQKYPAKKTSIDLVSDLADAPFPITALTTAGNTDVDAMYKPFYDKLESRKTQLQQLAKQHNKYQEIHDKEGNAGLEKRAAAEADKNAIVREMGGAEKLKNMSDAERKAAAEQMRDRLKQDPSLITGGSKDAGMKTMQQKLMSDPDYAKRFNSMSEAEKQTEMKKYMTIKPQEKDPNVAYTNNLKTTADPAAAKSIEVNELIARTGKRLEAATTIYNRMTTSSNNSIEAMNAELSAWISKTTNSIPIVELGEYGHDRDPELMQAMEITSKYARYIIARQEATLKATCWKQYKAAISAAMIEFNNYMDSYKWDQVNDSQLFNGTYNDPKVINAFAGFYDAIKNISEDSEDITKSSKNAQKRFEGLF
ncbi:MAG: hypothetical protein QM737_20905 [Ferruginibacter sp.]